MTKREASDAKEFVTCLCSDIDYEYLFASIEYGGQEIAIVTQEEGREDLKLEMVVAQESRPGVVWTVGLDGFLEAVQEAKRKLLER